MEPFMKIWPKTTIQNYYHIFKINMNIIKLRQVLTFFFNYNAETLSLYTLKDRVYCDNHIFQ